MSNKIIYPNNCEFCHTKPEVKVINSGRGRWYKLVDKMFKIKCGVCGRSTNERPTVESAIKIWNKRKARAVQPTMIAEAVALMEKNNG